jgi:hypothetical protein
MRFTLGVFLLWSLSLISISNSFLSSNLPRGVFRLSKLLSSRGNARGNNNFQQAKRGSAKQETIKKEKTADETADAVPDLRIFLETVTKHVEALKLGLKDFKLRDDSCEITVCRTRFCEEKNATIEDIYNSPNSEELAAISRAIFNDTETNPYLQGMLETREVRLTVCDFCSNFF